MEGTGRKQGYPVQRQEGGQAETVPAAAGMRKYKQQSRVWQVCVSNRTWYGMEVGEETVGVQWYGPVHVLFKPR